MINNTLIWLVESWWYWSLIGCYSSSGRRYEDDWRQQSDAFIQKISSSTPPTDPRLNRQGYPGYTQQQHQQAPGQAGYHPVPPPGYPPQHQYPPPSQGYHQSYPPDQYREQAGRVSEWFVLYKEFIINNSESQQYNKSIKFQDTLQCCLYLLVTFLIIMF